MNVFLAGVSRPMKNKKIQNFFKSGNKMHSFYHCKEGGTGYERKWFEMNMKNRVNLFLDSGAFSAWTQEIEIDIQEYIRFIKKYEHVIDVYANLDVIGVGSTQPNAQTAKKTLENQKIMEAAGLSPLPVFHFGEPFRYLERYVKNYDYIALGGSADKSGVRTVPWLDTCFGEYLCDEMGMPKIKTHGFGLTSHHIMLRYPWYSVDSTSWVATARFGSIYVPKLQDGKRIYTENAWKVTVSSRSPKAKETGKHMSTLPPRQQTQILEYIHEKGYKLGISRFEKVAQGHTMKENERWAEKKPKNKEADRLLEIMEELGVSNKHQLRDELNIIYYQDLEKSMPKWPWPFKRKELQGFNL